MFKNILTSKPLWTKKTCVILACGVIFLVCAYSLYRYHKKTLREPVIVPYEQTTNPFDLSKRLNVNLDQGEKISREIQYIHDGKSPNVTYYITSPSVTDAVKKTKEQIARNDPSLPKAVIEKSDRTAVTADEKHQKVDVYKINLDKKHKLKAGAIYIGDKVYPGVGYQQGRFEAMMYSRRKGVDGVALTYTVAEW